VSTLGETDRAELSRFAADREQTHQTSGRQRASEACRRRLGNDVAFRKPRIFLTLRSLIGLAILQMSVRGNSGVLTEDDVQWISAGKGIIHAELPNEDKPSHTLQLWLNLLAAGKMVESAYQDLLAERALRVDEGGATIRLLSGTVEGIAAPAQTQTQYLDLRLNAGAQIDLPVPASHNGFMLVLEGEVKVGAKRVAASPGQVLWLDYPLAPRGDARLDSLSIEAQAPAACWQSVANRLASGWLLTGRLS
jgi:pirin-like protein